MIEINYYSENTNNLVLVIYGIEKSFNVIKNTFTQYSFISQQQLSNSDITSYIRHARTRQNHNVFFLPAPKKVKNII